MAGAPPALVIAWLSGRSEKTVRAYRRDLEDFSRFIGAKSIDQAASALIGRGQGPANALALAYKHNLKGQGPAGGAYGNDHGYGTAHRRDRAGG